jgi:uncharacterized protein DUF5995
MKNSDSALLALASAGPVETHEAVLARLRAMGAELEPSDGLVWFIRLYTAMTASVVEHVRKNRFEDPTFIERLDCHWANLYFVALAAHITDPGTGPACWEPLFRVRTQAGILPVQYAVVGANAHINRDLPLALVTTCLELDREPGRETSCFADYQRHGAALEAALGDVKAWLLTPSAPASDSALGQLDDVLEVWSPRRAREAAWIVAEVRWALRASPVVSRHQLEALDRMLGMANRGLLHPLPHINHRPSSVPGR